MSRVQCLAAAKLNLTLEILGPRPDGYHELRSVMTTLDLFDTLEVEDGRGVVVSADECYDASALPARPDETNTIETALGLLAALRIERKEGARPTTAVALRQALEQVSLRLHKEIPAAAGLGGGSSDAVAALRALDHFWQTGLSEATLYALATEIGSDCPFFVRGGVQLAAGRGELLSPLPPPDPFWLCLLKPPVGRRAKTAYLYSLLRERHFSAGGQSAALAGRLQGGTSMVLTAPDLGNTFDAVADDAYGSLAAYRTALAARGALAVHLCGSGPTLYGLFADEEMARDAERTLRLEHFQAWAVRAPASG